jgi:hypothetical protein
VRTVLRDKANEIEDKDAIIENLSRELERRNDEARD